MFVDYKLAAASRIIQSNHSISRRQPTPSQLPLPAQLGWHAVSSNPTLLPFSTMLARRSVTACLRSLPRNKACYPTTTATLSPTATHSLTQRYSRAFSCTSSAMAAALQRSAFFEAIRKHDPSSTAVVNFDSGVAFSYGSLLRDVSRTKERLLQETGKDESGIAGERIAFMVENGYDYVGADSSLEIRANALVLSSFRS
jgi:hypothetical protein